MEKSPGFLPPISSGGEKSQESEKIVTAGTAATAATITTTTTTTAAAVSQTAAVSMDYANKGVTLPPIGAAPLAKNSTTLALRQKRLEWEDRRDALLKKEAALRSTILGLEYEERYRHLWAYHAETEKIQRGMAASKKVAAAWQQKKYVESVRAFQRWGSVWTEEMNAREELVAAEEEAWEYLFGWWEVEVLQIEQERLLKERIEAEELWEATEAVRRFEVAVGMSALRKQNEFEPKEPLEFVSSTIVTGVPDQAAIESKRAKVKYLMDYTVNEEEFQCRQAIRRDEAMHRILFTSEMEKLIQMVQLEWKERLELYEVFYAGWNEHRLSSIITIQRWWRQSRAHPWSFYRKGAYHRLITAIRCEQTVDDYKREIERLEQKLLHPSKDLSLHQKLVRLENAALRSYQPLMDEYVFTIQQMYVGFMEGQRQQYAVEADRCLRRYPDADRLTIVADESDEEWAKRRSIEKHSEILQSPYEVPKRLYTRYPLPYTTWRVGRWHEFAEKTLREAQAIREEEEKAREELQIAEARNSVGLEAFHNALIAGEEAVKQYFECVLYHVQAEQEARHVEEQHEKDSRADLNVHHCRLSDWMELVYRPTVLLMAEEAKCRRAVIDLEQQTMEALLEHHWRWDRLAAARSRVAARYGSRLTWDIAFHGLAANKFVSLKSAASILVRFFYKKRHLFRENVDCLNASKRASALTQTQELLLELRAAKLAKSLDLVFKDRRRGIRREQKARKKEIEQNHQLNGSRGYLSSDRSLLAGFSFVTREVEEIESSRDDDSLQKVDAPATETDADGTCTTSAFPTAPVASSSEQLKKLNTPAAAIDMGAWMEWFRIWLDEEGEKPREDDYKNVLLRFQNENREFFNDLTFLLSLMREGRKEIEDEEQRGRYYMRFRDDYRVCNTYMVTTLEHRRRRQLVAEEEDARYHLFSDLHYMKQTLKWGARAVQVSLQHPSQKRPWNLRLQRFPVRHVHPSEDPEVAAAKKRYLCVPYQPVPTNPDDIYSYVHNGPSLPNILKGRLFPDTKTVAEVDRMTAEAIAAAQERKNAKKGNMPILSILDRFVAREEVIRTGIEVARKRELASFLGDYSLAFRAAIEREEISTCLRRCARIDRKFPGHPPLALSRFIAVEEAMARRALEEEAWATYQEPLLAAHQQYLDGCLTMQFTFGHLTMTSHANYLDRRLLKLLTERVRYVKEKIDDLVELESASRTRLEYIAEITGEMRFKWKKLII